MSELLPIEPLSQDARRRIANTVVAEVGDSMRGAEPLRERRGWRLAMGFALAGVAAALVFFAIRSSPSSPISPEPTRIAAGASATEVSLGNATLTVGAGAEVFVDEDDGAKLVRLERGDLACDVPARGELPPFEVRAGEVRISVVEAKFAVFRSEARVAVEVLSGTLVVFVGSDETVLGAKERWSSDTGLAIATPREPAAVPREPAAAQLVAEEDAGVHAVAAPPKQARKPKRPRALRADAPVDAPVAPEHREVVREVLKTPSEAERYQQAASLERRKPIEALRLYAELEEGGGTWAASALFARARLQLERGQEKAAQVLLRRYLRRYPKGANAAMARRLLGASP